MSGGQEYPYGAGYTLGPPPNEYYRPGGLVARKWCHAMFVGQGASGLAEDKVVNGFNFRHETEDGALEADDYTEVRAAVTAFYEQSAAAGARAAQTFAIGRYISPWVSRTAELRLYDMNQAKPRVPITSAITLGALINTQGMPEEVAACLSFRTVTPNTARRRGRVYIGPLSNGDQVCTFATGAGPCRLATTFSVDLLTAANRLSMMSVGMRWCVVSGHDSDTTVHPVTYAWCDDALDTQRRRGAPAGTRLTLDLEPPA